MRTETTPVFKSLTYVTLRGLSFGAKFAVKIEGRQRAWPKSFTKMGHKNVYFSLYF